MDAIRWMALVPLVGLVLVPLVVETGPSATVWLPLRLGRRWPCRPNGRPPSPPPWSTFRTGPPWPRYSHGRVAAGRGRSTPAI